MLHSSFSPNPSCHTNRRASAGGYGLEALFKDENHCNLLMYHCLYFNRHQRVKVYCHENLSVYFGALTSLSLASARKRSWNNTRFSASLATLISLQQIRPPKPNILFSLQTRQTPDQNTLNSPPNDLARLNNLRFSNSKASKPTFDPSVATSAQNVLTPPPRPPLHPSRPTGSLPGHLCRFLQGT